MAERGTRVRAAAEAALTGTDSDVHTFLDEVAGETFQDNRVAAAQLVSVGGVQLQDAAVRALSGSAADLRTFLVQGWKEPLEQDNRVRVAQIVDAGGPIVKAAGPPHCPVPRPMSPRS
ncbi:hypothetical protein GXW82_42890 [Streptacidiphilus sp. 4-A2]|nr:hypothetical protein [Streptacidiphilus sp. 4-A2]